MANTFIVTGRLSERAEVKTSQKGNSYASVILINNEGTHSNHIPMVAFNEVAKELQNLSTATPILVTATVSSRTYNGFPRLNIYLNSFEILTNGNEVLTTDQSANTSSPSQQSQQEEKKIVSENSASSTEFGEKASTPTTQSEVASNASEDLDDFNFDDFDFD